MEKEKYYTPTIEEFHVGFECEYKSPLTGNWENVIYTEDMFFGGKRGLTQSEKRVKYLDKENIESLGWIKGEYKSVICFMKDDKMLTWLGNPFLDISVIPIFKNQSHSQIFRGIIKNKSELKKLMQQLNIL